jgi:hypothetical protein
MCGDYFGEVSLSKKEILSVSKFNDRNDTAKTIEDCVLLTFRK